MIELEPKILNLSELHPRLYRMILAIWRHQDILTEYDSLCLTFHCKGMTADPVIEKLPLNSAVDK